VSHVSGGGEGGGACASRAKALLSVCGAPAPPSTTHADTARPLRCRLPAQPPKASFVSTGSIPIGMDKYNKKLMIVTIRDPDLFRVEN
jgi:hypothetical protein